MALYFSPNVYRIKVRPRGEKSRHRHSILVPLSGAEGLAPLFRA